MEITKNKILIDNIWLEVELWYLDWDCKNYATFMGVRYAPKWGMNITNTFGFKTSISQEYYNNQVEFNIPWTKNKTANIKNKLKCLCKKLPKWVFTISCQWPAYVGTHIHYSFKYKDWIVNFPIKHKTMFLFRNLLMFYIDYFSKKIAVAKNNVERNTLFNELERLVKNHNILINYDTEELDRYIESYLKNHNNSFIYTNNRNNKKYRPIIWSEPRPGKPLTLEIRYISNLVGLDQEYLFKLNKMVEQTINSKNDFKGNVWWTILKTQVKILYKKLYELYSNLKKNAQTNNNTLMTINQYQDWLEWKLTLDYKWLKVNVYSSHQKDSLFNLWYKYFSWGFIYSISKNIWDNKNNFVKWLKSYTGEEVLELPLTSIDNNIKEYIALQYGNHMEVTKIENNIIYFTNIVTSNKLKYQLKEQREEIDLVSPFRNRRNNTREYTMITPDGNEVPYNFPNIFKGVSSFVTNEKNWTASANSVIFRINWMNNSEFSLNLEGMRNWGTESFTEFQNRNRSTFESLSYYINVFWGWHSSTLEEDVKNFFYFVYQTVKTPDKITLH